MKTDARKLATQWWSKFSGLPASHTAVVALSQGSQLRHLSVDEVLVKEGDEDATVFLIASGVLGTMRYTANGHDIWYADLMPGDLTGEMAALIGVRRTSSVVAKAACTVLAVDKTLFLGIANTHAHFAMAVARMLSVRLQATSKHLADVVSLPVSTRLHGELAALGTPTTGDGEVFEIRPPPKITELSQRTRTTRETTSRALGDLEQRGFLKRSRTAWTIIVPAVTTSG